MSRLYRHLVWLETPQQAITDAMLTVDDEVEEVSIHRSVDAAPHVEIRLTNPGWHIYAAGAARCAAIVESDDGTMATARVLARGTIRNLPDNLGKAAVTLTLECSSTTEETRLARNAAARAWEAANPEPENEYTEGDAFAGDITAVAIPSQDLLLGRMERDSDQVMVGRTLEWHCDPVSHAWSLHDFTVPMGTTRDVGETDPDKITRSAPKACPRKIKMRVICNFTPNFSGQVGLHLYLNTYNVRVTSMTSWAYELVQRPGVSTGWTMQQAMPIRTTSALPVTVGTVTYDLSTRRVYEELVPGVTPPQYVRRNTDPSWSRTRFTVEFDWFSYFFPYWTATWAYSQPRREVVDCVLEVPTQEVTGLIDELELADMAVQPLYQIPRFLTDDRDADETTPQQAQAYDESKTYFEGDLVLVNGREFRLTVPESTGVFWLVANWTSTGFDWRVDTRWEETHRRPAFTKPSLTVFDTRRGLATLAAATRIMRAKAFEFLYEDFGLQVDRPDFPDWSLGDSCRALIPGRHDEPQKEIEGRVVGIVERLRAEGGDVVELTLKVAKGQGGGRDARPGKINEFGASDYFDDDYIDTIETDWLSAGDDVEFTVEADPLYKPIDPARLNDHFYSVVGCQVTGSVDIHEARLRAMNDAGARIGTGLPSNAFPPTMISWRLRDLRIERTITRKYRLAAELTKAPRGISL